MYAFQCANDQWDPAIEIVFEQAPKVISSENSLNYINCKTLVLPEGSTWKTGTGKYNFLDGSKTGSDNARRIVLPRQATLEGADSFIINTIADKIDGLSICILNPEMQVSFGGVYKRTSYVYEWANSTKISGKCSNNKNYLAEQREMAVLQDGYKLTIGEKSYTYDKNVTVNYAKAGIFAPEVSVDVTATDSSLKGWTVDPSDYTVNYYDAQGNKLDAAPTAAGKYQLSVSGNEQNTWGESEKYDFSIIDDISGATVAAVGSTSFLYNSKDQTPLVSVTFDGAVLSPSMYRIISVPKSSSESGTSVLPDSYTLMVVSGAGLKYSLLGTVDYTISSVDLADKDACKATVTGKLAGSAPDVAVTYGGEAVDPSVYTVTYKDSAGTAVEDIAAAAAGTYVATITGDGAGCTNSVDVPFTVAAEGKQITTALVTANPTYTGQAVTPAFAVTDSSGNAVDAANYTVSYADADGAAVAAADLVNAGNYTATISAVGDTYVGQATCVFAIAAQEVSSVDVQLSASTYEYVPSAYWVDPDKVVPTGESATYRSEYVDPELTVTLGGKTLVEGTDFKVVYGEGVNNYMSSKATGSVEVPFSIELMGNYSGTVSSDAYKYTIAKGYNTCVYNGVHFRFAIEGDGTATITGLDMDIDENTTDFSKAYDSDYDGVFTIPSKVAKDGKTYQVKRVAARAFDLPYVSGNQSGTTPRDITNGSTKLVIEEGVETIGQDAFGSFFWSKYDAETSARTSSPVKELVLPESLKDVSSGAFMGIQTCVKNIVIPAGVQHFSAHAFSQNSDDSVIATITFEQASSIRSWENDGVGTKWDSAQGGSVQRLNGVWATPYGGEIDGGQGAKDKGYSDATMSEITIPASILNAPLRDFVNLTDEYFMGNYTTADREAGNGLGSYGCLYYTKNLTPEQKAAWRGADRFTVWGWDIADSYYAASAAKSSDYVSGFEPFAVLGAAGDTYAYTNAWNGETGRCNGTVEYAANVSVGTPVATVVGSDVTVDFDLQYNWVNKTNRTLAAGTDYTVEYKDAQGDVVESITEPGTYTATLTGNGKTCFGSQTVTLEVAAPEANAITDSCVSASGEGLTYNGSAQDATKVTVTVGGNVLEEGTDYTVAYTDNVNAGTATATVTGKGLYAGTAKATYEIAKAPLTITASSATKTVGGAEPELGYTPEGLVGGDVLASAKVAREAGETAGSYAVKVSGAIVLNADGTAVETANYAINYVDGTLTVEKAPATGVEDFVERLYTNVMGRTASQEEVDFQADGMKSMGAAQITYNFYNSDEFKAKAEGMTNAEIVENVYQTMLGRTADEGGLAMWTKYLDNGMSACALVAGFAESGEFGDVCSGYGIGTGSADQLRSMLEYRDRNAGVTAFASRMYTIVLSRAAEVAGLNVQCEALIGGTPCYQIALNFFDGEEYVNKAKSDTDFVADCYKAVMDREGSSSEIAAWVDRMADEGLTRTSVVKGFCQSDEFEKICQDCGMTSGMR